jgi:hypothetical protein
MVDRSLPAPTGEYPAAAPAWVWPNPGGLTGDSGTFEEIQVPRIPQPHAVSEGEVAEVVGGDQPGPR